MIASFFKWFLALFTSLILGTTPTPTGTPYTDVVLTPTPTSFATAFPTNSPSPLPTKSPTPIPSLKPTVAPTSAPVVNNTPPNSGFSRQSVKTDIGVYTVNIVAADINTTKVIVDTASSTDCGSNCPVLSLADYITRNGGYAGVNGSYFCPKDYASCSGKENSYDLLVMNKDKHYFNSDNNVYSVNPVVVFGSGYTKFVSQGQYWGRDTSVDGVLMNYPLLVSGGNVVFGGDGDPKKGSKGSRSFVANKGSNVYIGVTQNVTVAENALVLKAMGMENALNLDSGGSVALYSGGYKLGPGRGIPNAIVFKQK